MVQTRPKDFEPEELPQFTKLTDKELVEIFEGESQVRAVLCQRVLLRRKYSAETTSLLKEFMADSSKETRSRVLALYTFSQCGISSKNSEQVIGHLRPFAEDATLAPFVMRALGDMGLDLRTAGKPGAAPADLLIAGAESADPHPARGHRGCHPSGIAGSGTLRLPRVSATPMPPSPMWLTEDLPNLMPTNQHWRFSKIPIPAPSRFAEPRLL